MKHLIFCPVQMFLLNSRTFLVTSHDSVREQWNQTKPHEGSKEISDHSLTVVSSWERKKKEGGGRGVQDGLHECMNCDEHICYICFAVMYGCNDSKFTAYLSCI